MTLTYRLLLPTLLLGLSSPALGRPNLPKEMLDRLEQGKVLEFTNKVAGSSVLEGKAIGIFNDVPEAVAYILLDLDRYKSYLPNVTESRITKRRGVHSFGVVETDLPWPVKDCWIYIKFTRYNKPGRVIEIKWWMINGTMKNYFGTALLEPWNKDATRTVLSYQMLAAPKTSAPDSMISNGAKYIASVVVQRTRLRLQALRKFGKLPKVL